MSNEIEGIGYRLESRVGQMSRKEVRIYNRFALNQKAEMARSFVERWGAVAAEPVGEDSVGRQSFQLQDPHQLVLRACACAEYLFKEFQQAGWLLELPSPSDPEEESDGAA